MQYVITYFIYTGDSVTYSDICIHMYIHTMMYIANCDIPCHTPTRFSVIYITQNHISASSTDSKFFITL